MPCGWTKSISHHLINSGMIRFSFSWFQSGAKRISSIHSKGGRSFGGLEQPRKLCDGCHVRRVLDRRTRHQGKMEQIWGMGHLRPPKKENMSFLFRATMSSGKQMKQPNVDAVEQPANLRTCWLGSRDPLILAKMPQSSAELTIGKTCLTGSSHITGCLGCCDVLPLVGYTTSAASTTSHGPSALVPQTSVRARQAVCSSFSSMFLSELKASR